jgi:hypothetical protein
MLTEYGRDTMRALLGVFAKGSDQESALRQTLNVGLDQLDAIWRTSLGLGPRRTATPRPAADAGTAATPAPTDAPATSSARTGACRSATGLLVLPLAGAVMLATRRGGPAL